jgi:hypothetical protein
MMQKGSWKLTVGCIAALAAVVTMSVEGTTPVASKNIVGYVKVDLTANQWSLLSNPFKQVDGSTPTVTKVLGTQVPNSTTVYTWNGTAYGTSVKLPPAWSDPNLPMAPGAGWWVKAPSNATVLIMGEVPDDASMVSTFATKDNLIGYPYPVEKTLGASGLATVPTGASAFFWNGTTYTTAAKLPPGWVPNETMGLAEGFWLIGGAGFTWTEAKPY